jgi:hypothetical protein
VRERDDSGGREKGWEEFRKLPIIISTRAGKIL